MKVRPEQAIFTMLPAIESTKLRNACNRPTFIHYYKIMDKGLLKRHSAK